jgi:hypothetical protein
MLKGKRRPERLYVDIDSIDGDGGPDQPSSTRFMGDIVKKYQFSGNETVQLIEVAELWVDDPSQFAAARPGSLAASFKARPRSAPTRNG